MAKVSKMSEWSLLYLRLVLGVIFIYHGYVKLFVPGGFPNTVKFFASVGIPFAGYSALVTAVAELAGGILLLAGVLTFYSSLVLMFDMAVAFFYVQMKNGIDVSRFGFEYVLVLFVALLVIVMNNAGEYALGKMMTKNKHFH